MSLTDAMYSPEGSSSKPPGTMYSLSLCPIIAGCRTCWMEDIKVDAVV